MLKKWWFWTIIVLIILIIILLFIVFSNIVKIGKQDNTDLSPFEVIEYLEDKGYMFETQDYTYIYTTHYIILRNDEEGIWIQKIISEISDNQLTFRNKQINDESADMTSESTNETKEEQQQYEAYLNWLEDMGLTKMQLVDALDFYDSMNKIDT